MNGGSVTGTRLELIYHRPKLCMSSRAGKRWRPSGRRSRSRRLQVLRTPTGWPCPRCGGGRTRPGVSARRRGGRSKSSLFVFIRGSSGTVLVGGAFGGRRGGDQGIIVTVLRPIETPRVADISYISVYSYLGTATAPRLVAAMASRVESSSVLGLVGEVYISAG